MNSLADFAKFLRDMYNNNILPLIANNIAKNVASPTTKRPPEINWTDIIQPEQYVNELGQSFYHKLFFTTMALTGKKTPAEFLNAVGTVASRKLIDNFKKVIEDLREHPNDDVLQVMHRNDFFLKPDDDLELLKEFNSRGLIYSAMTKEASALWVLKQNLKHAWLLTDAAAEEEAFGCPQELGVELPVGVNAEAILKFKEFLNKLKK